MTNLLQSALNVALTVVRANPDVLEGLGAQLEGNTLHIWILILCLLKQNIEPVF